MRPPFSTRRARRRGRLSSRGTSLVELMIASSLMLLLLGAAYFAVSAGLRYQRRSEAMIDLDQLALDTMAYTSRELAETDFDAVHIAVLDPSAITFAYNRDANGAVMHDASGRLLWDSVVCYRLEAMAGGRKRLVRQLEEVGGDHLVPVDPSELTPPRDAAYFAASGLPARVLARDVVSLAAEKVTSGTAEMLKLKMAFEMKADNHVYGLRVSNEVTPRN